jgi:hypothetical protein
MFCLFLYLSNFLIHFLPLSLELDRCRVQFAL